MLFCFDQNKKKLSLPQLLQSVDVCVCGFFPMRLCNKTDHRGGNSSTVPYQFLLTANGTDLVTYFSQNGLHGEFRFIERADGNIEIRSSLETTLQFPEQAWEWSLHEMPIDYSDVNARRRCHATKIGTKIVDLTDHLDYILLPGNESSTWTVPANVLGEPFWQRFS